MNPFQDSYQNRLWSWQQLRTKCKSLPLEQALVEIDRWWQQAPLINHHFHWNDTENWTDAWTILSENIYCPLVRSVGMVYTILMCGIDDVQLVTATDEQAEEHYLVLVDGAKYTLSWWPNQVLNTSPNQFTIIRSKSLELIRSKIK